MWIADEELNYRISCEEGGIRAVLIGTDGRPLMVNRDGFTFEAGNGTHCFYSKFCHSSPKPTSPRNVQSSLAIPF